MTDDEINAALLPMLSKHIGVAETDCRILPFDRLAYRAGMRRAAQIAREYEFARTAAAAIERAAPEPPAA